MGTSRGGYRLRVAVHSPASTSISGAVFCGEDGGASHALVSARDPQQVIHSGVSRRIGRRGREGAGVQLQFRHQVTSVVSPRAQIIAIPRKHASRLCQQVRLNRPQRRTRGGDEWCRTAACQRARRPGCATGRPTQERAAARGGWSQSRSLLAVGAVLEAVLHGGTPERSLVASSAACACGAEGDPGSVLQPCRRCLLQVAPFQEVRRLGRPLRSARRWCGRCATVNLPRPGPKKLVKEVFEETFSSSTTETLHQVSI